MPELGPWQVLEAQTLLDRSPWLRVICQSVRLPSGLVIADYLLAPSRDYSLVVALTAAGQALLVRQYKHGLGRVVLDFPAGYLDSPDEDPLACAQRELREETGFAARRWTALCALALDTNRSSNQVHVYLARDVERVAAPRLDETEALEVLTRPARDIAGLLRSGEMPSVASAAAWGLAAAELSGIF